MSLVVPKPALSPRSLEKLRAWLDAEMKTNVLHELLTVGVFLLFSVLGHVAAFVFTVLVAARGFGQVLQHMGSIELFLLVPACILAAMYPYYFFVHKKKPVVAELSGGTVRIPCNRLTPETLFDSAPAGVRLVDFLFFPVWALDRAIVHLGLARKAIKPDTWAMARLLGLLYAEDRRVTAYDADTVLREPGLPRAMEALQVLPGVVFHTNGGLSVSLNDDLTGTISGQLED
jgi:hypothetical protein